MKNEEQIYEEISNIFSGNRIPCGQAAPILQPEAGGRGRLRADRFEIRLSGGNIRGNKEKMEAAFHALYAQAEEQLAEVDFTPYAEVLFVSKSVGTIIASAYAQKLEEAGMAADIRHILYTPLEATYTFAPKHAVAFIGTADPWSDVPAVIQMSEAQGVPMHVYENANHSLETSDTMQNLKILQDVMEKTKAII